VHYSNFAANIFCCFSVCRATFVCHSVFFVCDESGCSCVNQDGGTPLFVACQCNHFEVVEELVSNGADVQCQMVDGASPLFISSQNGHLQMVRYLLGKGAKPAMARKVWFVKTGDI